MPANSNKSADVRVDINVGRNEEEILDGIAQPKTA